MHRSKAEAGHALLSGAPFPSRLNLQRALVEKDEARAPLRILHVHSGNMYGGVETMLLTQARMRESHPEMQFSFALCFVGQLSEELSDCGAPLYWLGETRLRNPFSLRQARARLRELLAREAFDAVVTHSSWSQAIFGRLARESRVPLVFHQHGPTQGWHWLERWASRTEPDVALCNSSFTAATLASIYPRVLSEVVYCPVAPPAHSRVKVSARETRLALQTNESATVIIQVSRMEAWKGHALHLQALSLLKDVPGWVCWMVGGAQRSSEKKYLDGLQTAAARLGLAERVRFPGQRADVPELLAAADIYCQPNTGPEPFGIAFIEALYAGLPIVTTAIGGAREIIDESCGALVPPDDARALALSLRRLIEDERLRARLGQAGPARATLLCDPETQMFRLYQAFASIAGSRGKQSRG